MGDAEKMITDSCADDLEDFTQEFAGKSIGLHDNAVAVNLSRKDDMKSQSCWSLSKPNKDVSWNHSSHITTERPQNPFIKRFQLHVGNLTWWTNDRDILNAVHSIGVNDFLDLKFLENRANGQSKGSCVISLASEADMRRCMEKLPTKEIYGHNYFPLKFEAQSKTIIICSSTVIKFVSTAISSTYG